MNDPHGRTPAHRASCSRRALNGGLATGALALTFSRTSVAASSLRADMAATPGASPDVNAGATVVLVHGAWADGSSWQHVIELVLEAGTPLAVVQIPLTSLEDDVAAVQRIIALQSGPVVLVGHSYGGLVITQASAESPSVKALVYVSAFGPDTGESMQDLANQGTPSSGVSAIRPDASGYLWIDRGRFPTVFAADVPHDEAEVLAIVQKPLNGATLGTKVTDAGWHTVPSWFLISEDDQMIPAAAQHLMAQRMSAKVTSVNSSHASLISHPQDVVTLIDEARKSVQP